MPLAVSPGKLAAKSVCVGFPAIDSGADRVSAPESFLAACPFLSGNALPLGLIVYQPLSHFWQHGLTAQSCFPHEEFSQFSGAPGLRLVDKIHPMHYPERGIV